MYFVLKILNRLAISYLGFPGGAVVKHPPAMQKAQETQIQSLGQEDSPGEGWQPTPVFLTGKFHGQRSLAGSSARGCKRAGPTERSAAPVITASSSVFTPETRSALCVSLLTTHPDNHWSFHCFHSFAFLESYSCDHTVCSLFRLPYFT